MDLDYLLMQRKRIESAVSSAGMESTKRNRDSAVGAANAEKYIEKYL